jgi:transcriptional regulator with XRE-family HTH domain
MTPKRLEACLQELGWMQPELARRLGVRLSTIRQWLSGRRAIPPNVDRWLEDLARRVGEAPSQPEGWSRE